ncbi:envelope integrity protein Cei [Rhodococcus triatomae]|uniref:LytR cell envelope-related transcriptional attenuator n=1 Tax=Rhodococcus triatomae TaxID=300028 RepID=A0A1G8MRH5_9NOCA|nr:envelope integrity protein Cei [Rhodococcus triatomae]QNG19053.1 envelope integrity protein Cei [Rhodococcus triatomae]QNG25034.1 envelope integrity protein Cei [Rhodococcus triatomae]SDI69890.1 LytR cell envelope-related transcriptional attenuator [Rhodococcus triatomae]
MVSLITEGSSTDDQGRPFRRRRAAPILAVFSVLALLGAVLWVTILTSDEETTEAVSCNPPPSEAVDASLSGDPAAALGTRVDRSVVTDVEPAALSATKVRVFNGNGEHGQAAQVAAQLNDYGFASAPDVQVGNDPIYTDQNLQCQGQLRFGQEGRAAASALWLIAPCAELIEDARPDDTVDLALGTYFRSIAPNADAEEVLRSLEDAPPGAEPAPLDPDLLAAARTARC